MTGPVFTVDGDRLATLSAERTSTRRQLRLLRSRLADALGFEHPPSDDVLVSVAARCWSTVQGVVEGSLVDESVTERTLT